MILDHLMDIMTPGFAVSTWGIRFAAYTHFELNNGFPFI